VLLTLGAPERPRVVSGRVVTMADRLALAVASAGGVGFAPVASGTAGSFVAAVALWLIPGSSPMLLAALVVVTAAGVWAGARAERMLGHKDPRAVVIDEVAGMMLSVLLVPRTPAVLAVAFVFFRIFDVWKPFPAHQSQALPGGWGIMADDLIAGVYALVVVLLARAFSGFPA
jgi:phosphatidylglycerophosphatase A